MDTRTKTDSDQVHTFESSNEVICREVINGLSAREKHLPSKLFYDAKGAALFTDITRLDEYYLTRTENGILHRFLPEITEAMEAIEVLIEYGSGDSDKTHLLLENLPGLTTYVPIDVSKEQLLASASHLSTLYPSVRIDPHVADFTQDRAPYARQASQSRTAVFFPGSTIGNFEHAEAVRILERIAGMVGSGGGLLIGVDLAKDVSTVEKAYNDRLGVTAEFNKNILSHINSRLGSDFDLDRFDHSAVYDHTFNRIEMYLVSNAEQVVHFQYDAIEFAMGERIRTEYSHKYPLDIFTEMSTLAGFVADHIWTDDDHLFSVQYLRVP